jgi:hypothetical protein
MRADLVAGLSAAAVVIPKAFFNVAEAVRRYEKRS